MNEKEREQVALFRFGLIAPLYNGQVDTKTYLNEVEGKVHQMPYYRVRRIATKTVQDWLLKYRKGGFEALKPKKRSDRGYSRRLSPEDQEHILAFLKKFPYMPVTVFYEQLIRRGEIVPVNGRKKKTFLIAYIDFCSRVVPYAQFSLTRRSMTALESSRRKQF